MARAGQIHLSASLMCARLDALGQEVEALEEAGIDGFHLDVMDGHFVPNLALSPDTVAAIRSRTSLPLEVHLMVARPERYFDPLADARANVVFFHLEASEAPERTAAAIVDRGMAAGLAVSPRTALPSRSDVGDVSELLLMAVEPGFSGGAWLQGTPDRVRQAAGIFGDTVRIHVDGHVDAETALPSLVAGATGFVCGTSSLFRPGGPGPGGRRSAATDYARRLDALRAALAAAARPIVAAASA